MSRRAEERRIDRFDKKGDQYLASGFWPMPSNRMHGPCRRCSRRTYLWKPLKICSWCNQQAKVWVCTEGNMNADDHKCECGRRFSTLRGLRTHERYCWKVAEQDGCPICTGGQGRACMSHFV